MKESDSRSEVGDVESRDAVVGAVCCGGGDVVDSVGDLRVEEIGVGQYETVTGDETADAGREEATEFIPDAEADDGAGDFLSERHEFFLGGCEWSSGRFMRKRWRLFAWHEGGKGLEVGVIGLVSLGALGGIAVFEVEQGVGRVIEAWRKAWSVREG